MPAHPTTTAERALRAMHVLAADLAAERREAAALRREIMKLRAENEALRAGRRPEPEIDVLRPRAPMRAAAAGRARSPR